MPTSEVVAGAVISCTPPCSADCCCISLPSWLAGNSLTVILPPLLAATSSANFLTPDADRVVGVVQVAEADRALLDVLRPGLHRGACQHRDKGGRKPGISCFHVSSEWKKV